MGFFCTNLLGWELGQTSSSHFMALAANGDQSTARNEAHSIIIGWPKSKASSCDSFSPSHASE